MVAGLYLKGGLCLRQAGIEITSDSGKEILLVYTSKEARVNKLTIIKTFEKE